MDNLAVGAKPAVLRCGRCGKFVDRGDARLQVVCGCRSHLNLPPVLVREATLPEREKALKLFKRDLGHMQFVTYGEAVSLEHALALVAEADGGISTARFTSWRSRPNPMCQRTGVGGHLVAEAELLARRQERLRVIVTITNDNIPAL